MTALATHTELQRLAQERERLVAWLARQFPDVLSFEDAEDLVSEALPELASDPRLPARGRRRRNYRGARCGAMRWTSCATVTAATCTTERASSSRSRRRVRSWTRRWRLRPRS